MSRSSTLCIRLVAGAALALGFADVVRAQGEGATTATTAAPRDGIAEAKKDFDGIKSIRDASLLPNSRMPKISAPELSLPTPTPTTAPTKAKSNPRDAKTSNWLVDAMEKTSSANQLQEMRPRDRKDRSGGRERDRDVEDDNRDGQSLAEIEKDNARIERERRDQQREEDVTSAVVANPLNDFLGTWMTPQDYSLLKPGLTPSTDSGLGAKASTLPSSISGTIPGGGLSDLTRTGSASPAITIPPPRENPYLQSMKTDLPNAVPTARRQIDILPIVPPSRPPPIIAPTPVAPSPSKIPEFAKPPTDDRYFKQLKRF